MTDDNLNLTPFDFEIKDHGSLVTLHPRNDAASAWVDEHIYGQDVENLDDVYAENPPQWFGDGLVIEPRYVLDIVQGIENDGLTVRAS